MTGADRAAADRTANVLGALALALGDLALDAVADATGHPATAAAALSSLHQFLGQPTLDVLGRVVGLTPSGAVRLVDRLEADGLVTRGPGTDGRSRAVTLTRAGTQAATRGADARLDTLRAALDGLSSAQVRQLSALLDRVVANVVTTRLARSRTPAGWTCRLCDLAACGRADGHCPAATTAAAVIAAGG